MIFLRKTLVEGLDSDSPCLHSVHAALQNAIELEHATIPPYLYALYSLDEKKNADIARIIDSVVVEEMLHMTLSCNVLNAVGGAPDIDHPGFIPTYPGPLPGHVHGGLTVHLAPFSLAQLETFLQIEEPEPPLHVESPTLREEPITIGDFYRKISEAIEKLGDSIFVDSPRRQVGPDLMRQAVVVTDVATAQQAIDVIIEQGEGTSTSPYEIDGPDTDGHPDFAHYYRFMEIKEGRRLVPVCGGSSADEKFSYSGSPVPLDESGVYVVPRDPSSAQYSHCPISEFANNNFNYNYTGLLRALHQVFNEDDTGCKRQIEFNRAIGLMMSLKGQAKAMMSGIPDATAITGPSFEYFPVNARSKR